MKLMTKVRKRNGDIVDFDDNRIINAITKALKSTDDGKKYIEDGSLDKIVKKLTNYVIKISKTEDNITIEKIHDNVETVLMEEGYFDAAKNYILYRNKKKEKRIEEKNEKKKLLNLEQLDPVSEKFSLNSLRVLESRYLIKDENLKVIETPTELFERVATHVGAANIMYDEKVFDKDGNYPPNTSSLGLGSTIYEDYHIKEPSEYEKMNLSIGKYTLNGYTLKQLESLYAKLNQESKMKVKFDKILEMLGNHEFDDYERTIKNYFDLMATQKSMPNTPTIINAGRRLSMLSACFILNIEDDLKKIMDTVSDCAIISKMGGGIGINYSKLREEGSRISSTSGVSSGPLSFMNIINCISDNIKQGGTRRSANMGVLNSSHPDLYKFIHAKETPHVLENFNVSVGTDNKFWEAYKNNKPYELISPLDGKVKSVINAHDLMYDMAKHAYSSAEPGILFFDIGNKYNIMRKLKGDIMCTNPCVTGDTRLATDKGLVTVKELYEKQTQIKVVTDNRSYNPKKYGTQLRDAVPVFKTSDNIDVWKVTTKHGYEVKATSYHKFILPNGDRVELKDLKVGEDLMIQSGEGRFGNEGNYNIGLVLGWLEGDGYIDTNNRMTLQFNGEKMQVAERILESVNSIIVPTKSTNGLYNQLQLVDVESRNLQTITSSRMYEWLMSIGYKKGHIPEIVWQGTRECIKGYLSALFSADGTVNVSSHKSTCSIRLTQIDKDLLKEVQVLLTQFGIESTIYHRRKSQYKMMPDGKGGKKEYWCKDLYELNIGAESRNKFLRQIGFILKYKNKKVADFIKSRINPIPCRNNFISKISSIEYVGKEPVYDTTEDLTHSIVVSGIVTGQCGEILMYPDEPCTLKSINLGKFVKNKQFDFESFGTVVKMGVRFLDNVVDINKYPVEAIDRESWRTRRIGLGVMGLADLLYILNIPYNSEEGFKLQEEIAQFFVYKTFEASIELAKERGSFPYFEQTSAKDGHMDVIGYYEDPIMRIKKLDWNKISNDIKKYGIRNCSTTTVAPTGTISMIADCSSGIEPLFALAFEKKVSVGNFVYINEYLQKYLKDNHIQLNDNDMNIIKKGSIRNTSVPKKVKDIFITAMDMHHIDHVFAQALWQNWITQSISKTVNMANNCTVDDVLNAYLFAHEVKCKGITVYRDGSRHTQVLYTDNIINNKKLVPSKYAKKIYDEKMKNFSHINMDKESKVEVKTASKDNVEKKQDMKDLIKKVSKDICPNCSKPTTKTEGCAICYGCGVSFC